MLISEDQFLVFRYGCYQDFLNDNFLISISCIVLKIDLSVGRSSKLEPLPPHLCFPFLAVSRRFFSALSAFSITGVLSLHNIYLEK